MTAMMEWDMVWPRFFGGNSFLASDPLAVRWWAEQHIMDTATRRGEHRITVTDSDDNLRKIRPAEHTAGTGPQSGNLNGLIDKRRLQAACARLQYHALNRHPRHKPVAWRIVKGSQHHQDWHTCGQVSIPVFFCLLAPEIKGAHNRQRIRAQGASGSNRAREAVHRTGIVETKPLRQFFAASTVARPLPGSDWRSSGVLASPGQFGALSFPDRPAPASGPGSVEKWCAAQKGIG